MALKEQLMAHTQEGTLWAREKSGAVSCHACGHRCFIPQGHDGICKVRSNVQGTLKVPWQYTGQLQIDPIEKKPFFHVLPSTKTLSFGMLGCDFHCAYCQNWFTSQTLRDPKASARPEPKSETTIAQLARDEKVSVVVSTYNEPLITAEWAAKVFESAKKQGLYTAIVSNGNATPEVLTFLRPYVDFIKIDLKGFRDRPYRQLGGVLKNILDSIEQVYRMGYWLEIVTLLVPGFNDSDKELTDLTHFIAEISPNIPWHVSAFHQNYKMQDPVATPASTLHRAAQIGKKAGLRFVYVGNVPHKLQAWKHTYCSNCQFPVVLRKGFVVKENRLVNGHCPRCKKQIPGHYQQRVA